eukprot:tig00020610_g12072.t1
MPSIVAGASLETEPSSPLHVLPPRPGPVPQFVTRKMSAVAFTFTGVFSAPATKVAVPQIVGLQTKYQVKQRPKKHGSQRRRVAPPQKDIYENAPPAYVPTD